MLVCCLKKFHVSSFFSAKHLVIHANWSMVSHVAFGDVTKTRTSSKDSSSAVVCFYATSKMMALCPLTQNGWFKKYQDDRE